MLTLNQETTVTQMPDVDADLLEAQTNGYFEGLHADRVMAALEMLRHGEITLDQTAALSGLTNAELIALLRNLPISLFQALAQRTCD
jgi:hypothetical protein